jgi:hypothetical protein
MKSIDSMELAGMARTLETFVHSALRDKTAESFESLEQQVNRLDSFIRELQQSRCADEARHSIRRLEGNEPLTDNDRNIIRSLVVGDAECYLEQQNNLNNWLEELERLNQHMQHLADAQDEQDIRELHGVVKDAVHLLPNIRSYMEDKERLDRFNAALASLDDANRKLLVEVLREKLASPSH